MRKKEYLYKLVQAYVEIVDVCGPIKGWVQTEPPGTCNSPPVQGVNWEGRDILQGLSALSCVNLLLAALRVTKLCYAPIVNSLGY